MPISLITSLVEKSGKSESEVEKLYSRAKKVVENEYNITEKDGERFFALVTGVLKKMLGLSDNLSFFICENCASPVMDDVRVCPECDSVFDGNDKSIKLLITKKDVDSISAFLNVMLNNRVVFKDLIRYVTKTAKAYGENLDSISLGSVIKEIK